jgi:hypothetical protein
VDARERQTYVRQIAMRRKGINAMLIFGIGFIVVSMIITYSIALHYGYGTGFGDGHDIPSKMPKPHGTGFLGDMGLLVLALSIDVGLITLWGYVVSRLAAGGPDSPPVTDFPQQDDEWYVVPRPGLVRALVPVAWIAIIGIRALEIGLLPWVLIKFGWSYS